MSELAPQVRFLIPCWKEPTMTAQRPSAHEVMYSLQPKEGLHYPVWQRTYYVLVLATNLHGVCRYHIETRLEELETETVIQKTEPLVIDSGNDPLRVQPVSVMMSRSRSPRPAFRRAAAPEIPAHRSFHLFHHTHPKWNPWNEWNELHRILVSLQPPVALSSLPCLERNGARQSTYSCEVMNMNDDFLGKDETEPVCAPLIRLEATVRSDNGAPATNGLGATDFDQTEPCAFAPIIRLQAGDDGQIEDDDGNTKG
jgi:hypothetical protein